ncbi:MULTISPECIES: hypothetical protein [unclassified Corynebacterium]|uniref:hypothetical protein n=1 Tax=unclassified Corynebacterium TaxID=2624378 RepID=UPI0008A22FAD|nr:MULTISPECIES: hypothetical protein [unclassified Corynebacterium]OFN75040.1 hypothetical protein HMPREF2537_00150 [Corynebacterium sp. HMSC074E01]OHO65298.1 hypothetical protein HMPREF2743_06525 [Corynebacterium sp. HMSC036D02]
MTQHRTAAALTSVLSTALLALGVAGCASTEEEPTPRGDDRIVGKDWQVINLYTSPDAPSTIPDDTAQVPHMSFGEHTAVGSTGCVSFTAEVSFHKDDKASTIWEGDVMRVEKAIYESPPRSVDCEGSVQWADSLMRNLIAEGHEFDFSLNPNNQLVLTLRTDKVDSPIIRMASL